MAQSDTYFATKVEALAELRAWGAGPLSLSDNILECWEAVTDDGEHVYLERIYVTPTRAGIAFALKNIPHR